LARTRAQVAMKSKNLVEKKRRQPSNSPPARMSPDSETNSIHDQTIIGDQLNSNSLSERNAAAAAVAGAQQPKGVQTAFIHKLYK
jgi:spore coat protein CotF